MPHLVADAGLLDINGTLIGEVIGFIAMVLILAIDHPAAARDEPPTPPVATTASDAAPSSTAEAVGSSASVADKSDAVPGKDVRSSVELAVGASVEPALAPGHGQG